MTHNINPGNKVQNRRRSSLVTRRSRDSLLIENDVVAGNALRRNYADCNERDIREQYQLRISKYKGASSSIVDHLFKNRFLRFELKLVRSRQQRWLSGEQITSPLDIALI